MNVFMVTGRLGRDAQVKTPQSGGEPFVVFSIAEDQFFKGAETTVWYEVIANETKKIKAMVPHLKKGSGVVVTGFQHVSLEEYNGDKKIRITIYADRVEFNSTGKSGNSEPTAEKTTKEGTSRPAADEDIPMKKTNKKAATKPEPAPVSDDDGPDDDLPF